MNKSKDLHTHRKYIVEAHFTPLHRVSIPSVSLGSKSVKYRYIKPSFLEGVSRIADIGGTLRDLYVTITRSRHSYKRDKIVVNEKFLPEDADLQALASDWCAVAQDMETATKKLVSRYELASPKSHSSSLRSKI